MGKSLEMKALSDLSNYQLLRSYSTLSFPHVHVAHIALLQHSNLYESIASSLHKAQKKALGNTLVGKELCILVRACKLQNVYNIQSEFFQIIGERRRLRIGGHIEVVCVSSPGWGRLQRKSSEVELPQTQLCHLVV
jgi:hypothetical protein